MMPHHEIEAWLIKYNIINYAIRLDGVVDVDAGVDLSTHFGSGDTLPIHFGHVETNFWCSYTNLISLHGAPYSVGGDFNCARSKITSLQYAPQSVGGTFNCFDAKITSLHGIHEQINHIGGSFLCSDYVTHLLGLLLIDGILHFNIDDRGPIDDIFNKYVGTGDILSAQDELIDAGFIEQARL
jgi:hypothetical protein